MRLALLILLMPLLLSGTEADSTAGAFNIVARTGYGFLIAHRPALVPLQEEHVRNFEVTIARQYNGNEYWQQTLLYPNYGITVAAFDLGTDKLGAGIAVYPFIDFPLSKKTFRNLHFRYGLGLGYVEKTFDPETNIKNSAIGSHVNGVIHFDLHYSGNISPRTRIEAGPAITHYSNGSYTLPNLGINIATFNFGVEHSFGAKMKLNRPEPVVADKRHQFHFYTGGFLKKIYPPEGKNYFAVTLSGLWYKPVNIRSAFGAGTDLFFDNSIVPRIDALGEKESRSINNFRSGVYGSYQLLVGHVGLIFNMGYYLYNAWAGDGNIYHRIGFKYYFEKMFICMNLKTHYARADFIEAGAGIRISKKSK